LAASLDRLRSALGERYDIVRELGRGGMAIVYLARDHRHDRQVAIKVMRPEVSAQSNTQRFLREIKVAARLQHPHILTVHDSGSAGGDLYYVMPYVEGESLRERIARGPMTVEATVEIAREVADALDYAHRQGVIHRDIKPENILLTAGSGNTGGHAVVADFGIARAVDVNREPSATATGIAVGSPAYMSPEQAMGWKEIDGRSDVYSLGCVVYEMLTGKPPFGRGSARQMMAGHVSGSPEALGAGRSHIPTSVQLAVEKAMAKEPENRFKTAAEFKDALKADSASLSLLATAALRRVRPRTRVAMSVAALAAAAAIGFFVRTGSGASLRERAAVIIADVDNATGDPVFRNSLVTALSAGLGQSDRVTLMSRSRIGETLARMERGPGDSLLNEKIAREVAVREGWAAVVLPSIAVFDSTYVITARLLDPATGSELASETVRSRGKNGIIDALDDLSRAMRRALGESRLAVFRQSNPLPQVTTRSLDALEKYAAGSRAWDAGRMDEARTLWSGAIELDSNFALAHVGLGRVYSWQNNPPLADKHFQRAFANQDRITDRERMWAEAQIASARGNWSLAATNYRNYITRFPGFPPAWLNLGTTLMRDTRPREALAAFAEYMRLDSTSGSAYINMATSYTLLGKYDSAVTTYRKAFAVRPDLETWFNINHEYGMTLVKADRASEARAVFEKMEKRPTASDQARGHRSAALLDLLEGQPLRAMPRLKSALAINASLRETTSEVRNHLFLASAYDLAGDERAATQEVLRAHQLYATHYLEPVMSSRLARALVRHGRAQLASTMLDTIRKRVTSGNNLDRAHMLMAVAEVARARGNRDTARVLMQEAAVLDSSAEILGPLSAVRAETGDLPGAIAGIKRLQLNQSNVGYEAQFEWSLARYHLGMLYERAGDREQARREYEAFLSEWQSADPALPAMVDTRARLKRLLALQPRRES